MTSASAIKSALTVKSEGVAQNGRPYLEVLVGTAGRVKTLVRTADAADIGRPYGKGGDTLVRVYVGEAVPVPTQVAPATGPGAGVQCVCCGTQAVYWVGREAHCRGCV